MRVGLSTTAIFGDLSGYFFGNIYMACKYMGICYPLSARDWLENEWPWVAMWCKTRFSH